MGLGFHIGLSDINNWGKYVGELDMDEHYWLQQNEFIIKGGTGHLPEDPILSLPYFDDVVLTHIQVLEIKSIFDKRKLKASKVPGFSSLAVAKYEEILDKLVKEEKGLTTLAD